ncbi:MAG: helix-turn-helix transcriptional regulator [Pseudomonadales bacterium]|nr:helix-turn-helix transcriptional regulator [Pseudomonadales bacterium]
MVVIVSEIKQLNTPDLTSAGWRYGALIAAFAMIGLLAAVDLLGDLDEGVSTAHVLIEGSVVLIALIASTLLIRALVAALKEQVRELDDRLVSSDEAADIWRAEAQSLLLGLGASIDRQFDRWRLSAAEKEVALLLLKGLAHKEIARARGVSEATARQQATAVYRKAGVAGRNALAAFFLEDLTLPPGFDAASADPNARMPP